MFYYIKLYIINLLVGWNFGTCKCSAIYLYEDEIVHSAIKTPLARKAVRSSGINQQAMLAQ